MTGWNVPANATNVSELIPSVVQIYNTNIPGGSDTVPLVPTPNNIALIAIKNTGTTALTVSPTAIIYVNFLIINPSSQILSNGN